MYTSSQMQLGPTLFWFLPEPGWRRVEGVWRLREQEAALINSGQPVATREALVALLVQARCRQCGLEQTLDPVRLGQPPPRVDPQSPESIELGKRGYVAIQARTEGSRFRRR